MGSPISQIQAPQSSQPQGKSGPMQQSQQPAGKGGNVTYPGQGGQPQIGQPNRYSNTVGPWDNASIGTQNPFQRSGKGKGA